MPSRRCARIARLAVAGALAVSLLGACDDQDPGVDQRIEVPEGTTGRTSNTLGPCPDGGPDATTPEAGCLDPDGDVQRP